MHWADGGQATMGERLIPVDATCAAPRPEMGELAAASAATPWDFFTNFGRYMPRTHCLVNQAGEPDWPWIIALIALTLGVVAAYARIYVFWLRTHRKQAPQDRNQKMFQLAHIFFWCAACGYAFSIVAFAWPAYRLLAAALLLLNLWSWRFVLTDLGDFERSLCAEATERKLSDELEQRNRTLSEEVRRRTLQLDEARLRAEAASDAKGRFLATMSHEIRTPMSAILGYADLLRDGDDPRMVREAGDAIGRSASRLLHLLDDVLDVSKIDRGDLIVERREVRALPVLGAVLARHARHAHEKGLTLSAEVRGSLPKRITTDPERLAQLVGNLLDNAVKFTDHGGVTIRVLAEPDQRRLRITVVDTGIGMDPEQRDRVLRFDAFHQEDSSATRRFGGSGLGLRISAALARMLGGELIVESEAGVGSTFACTIDIGDSAGDATPAEEATRALNEACLQIHPKPASVAAMDAPPPQPEIPPLETEDHTNAPLRGMRVLVAEDGRDNQRLVAHFLTLCGAEHRIVDDGRQAVDAACDDAEAFDLILMDLQMPVLDGYEATRAIRARGVATPILAASACVMPEEEQRCREAGFDGFLPKPFSRDGLVDACIKHAHAAER
ncbi:MAG: ATP-binding protein [Planctomycetota bacterium]